MEESIKLRKKTAECSFCHTKISNELCMKTNPKLYEKYIPFITAKSH